jgi:hypothetical protein
MKVEIKQSKNDRPDSIAVMGDLLNKERALAG